ncbi:protein disulfide isomerase pTAC5, chloroplastic-like isoform X3 [Olea europaea var. sylvestris]|uniref:protein disulfide isomerase pTAC5, chloroplastic-like isoform X3 n=1 Tax=Olea europaea var. sylvestris TaxID=158386 RepID=UPI000C1CF43F|nr:protein disulfide isomerase pTAC5, chloroplastic-like isoform X3 [Olea europaea var. sylvestris]
MSSTLPLSSKINPPLLHKPQFLSHFATSLSLPSRPFSKSHICFSIPPSSNSNSNSPQEEARWLREEQRWLREEQRWIREESRWNAERETLLHEIHSLKLRIQELERLNSLQGASASETVANIAKLLQVYIEVLKEGDLGKNVNRLAESGSIAVPLVIDAAKRGEEVIVKEVIKVADREENVRKRETLRKGSEGDEVRVMQKLGFYSGEEDMEYSSFSSGTERAVKTWQATLGAPEDGIMTSELLERLCIEQKVESSQGLKPKLLEKSENGALTASTTAISEVQQTVSKEDGTTEVEVSHHRVFLLGENRWEEPSRLSGKSNQTAVKNDKGNTKTKCLTCRGEGRLLCMECDGSGEPNIEPQFLEWVDEGTKCPYCEGLGYTTCDVCAGTKFATA